MVKRILSLLIIVILVYSVPSQALAVQTGNNINTYIINGVRYTVTVQDQGNDFATCTVESADRRVEALRQGNEITIKTITTGHESKTLPNESNLITFSLVPKDVIQRLPQPRSLIANGGSKYWTDDYWYSYNEWHIYYGNQLVNTGMNPTTYLVNRCQTFKNEILDADEALEYAVSRGYGYISGIWKMISVATVVEQINSGLSLDGVLAAISLIPGLGQLMDASALISGLSLTAAHHRNYHQAWMDVRDRV